MAPSQTVLWPGAAWYQALCCSFMALALSGFLWSPAIGMDSDFPEACSWLRSNAEW